MWSHQSRVGPLPNVTDVLIKEEKSHKDKHTQGEGRTLCDNRGRDWSGERTNQGTSKIANHDQNLGRGKEGCSP